MFIEKIDEELLDEIREEMEEEYSQIVGSWDGEFINLESDDLEDTLRTEIFEHYHHIPFYKLESILDQHFPFIKEKDISIEPHSKIIITENNGYKDVELQVYANVDDSVRNELSEIESKQLDKLLSELTQLYKELEMNNSLSITHVSLEEVPEEYYEGEDDDEHNYIRIEF